MKKIIVLAALCLLGLVGCCKCPKHCPCKDGKCCPKRPDACCPCPQK